MNNQPQQGGGNPGESEHSIVERSLEGQNGQAVGNINQAKMNQDSNVQQRNNDMPGNLAVDPQVGNNPENEGVGQEQSYRGGIIPRDNSIQPNPPQQDGGNPQLLPLGNNGNMTPKSGLDKIVSKVSSAANASHLKNLLLPGANQPAGREQKPVVSVVNAPANGDINQPAAGVVNPPVGDLPSDTKEGDAAVPMQQGDKPPADDVHQAKEHENVLLPAHKQVDQDHVGVAPVGADQPEGKLLVL